MADRATRDDAGRQAADGTLNQTKPPAENAVLAEDDQIHLPLEYDRRGIALPRRHKVGGIITPR
ncbi:MAG: hypothetical protein ACR2JE_08775 [Acidobacteriaceae bacterium]